MAMPRVFVSFDFDHDAELKNALVGQSGMENVPFEFSDGSLTEPVRGNWKAEADERIERSDMVWVICGEHTDTATGVSSEVQIARKQGKPVYYIEGRKDKTCRMPKAALSEDRMLDWTWENLAAVLRVPVHPRETDPMPLGDALLLAGTVIGGTVVTKEAWRALTSKPPKRRSYARTSPPAPHAWY